MKKLLSLFLLSSFIFSSCAPATQASQAEVINVYATSAAQPWLMKLYSCAADSSVVLNVTTNEPDIYLRIGEPGNIIYPVFKIDEEEILIVTNRESPIQNLTLAEAQDLFALGNPTGSAQVWIYSSDADVQIAFDQLVMKGRSVTSLARLATSSQQMSDLLNAEKDAVGILPKHWKVGTVRDVFSAGTVPVLAVAKEEPQGAVRNLISCLQK